MIILFISSGLFLGWTLGANDAANIFGSAVGSRMLSFTRAAVIASVFVVLGAVMQGSGASDTLGRLGSVNAIGGAFTVALAAGVTVYIMTKAGLPVSTTQAIVGAIIGWNFFTDNAVDTKSLTQIVSTWITGPILGALFAYALYHLVKDHQRRIKDTPAVIRILYQDRTYDCRSFRGIQPRGKQYCQRDGGVCPQRLSR